VDSPQAVRTAGFGTWSSSLGAEALVDGAVGLGSPCRRGDYYLWQESRPLEGGRVVIVSRHVATGRVDDLLPPDMSARTMVHEYGGLAWAPVPGPSEGGAPPDVVTANLADHRLWLISPGQGPRPMTPEVEPLGAQRFACPVVTPDGAWSIWARERHLADGQVLNDLVCVALGAPGANPGEPQVLAQGHDFYSSPRLSPDGRELAFICWDHPNMPWDVTQLWRGRLQDGCWSEARAVVGADSRESVVEPRWAQNGDLTYISDRTGWWNLYREGRALAPMEAEFAGPAWSVGGSSYVFLADGTLVATWASRGNGYLGVVKDGRATALALPYTSFRDLAPAGTGAAEGVLVVAGGPATPSELVRVSLDGQVEVLRPSGRSVLAEAWVSAGQAFDFPTGTGEEAHGLYYPPKNPEFRAPPGEKPPLIVTSHGGPTAQASSVMNLGTQYWTTRGFAVVDVDYRGSSGYGRRFRRSLDGLWGVADVDDCAAAARWLAGDGRADPERMVIRGSSASGLTALAALARHDDFAAAAVRYGVADLASLAATTHKFESHYIDRLVPADQYVSRSPLHLVDGLGTPTLLLQGLDDKVVPPDQSRQMVAALRQRGSLALLVEIEGEGHGFRKAATLARAQQAELAFYGQVLGLVPADDLAQAHADLRAAAGPGGATWA
jgi:dipeptidyl aminopeptidase/acylaminoacyl peptidase